MNNETTLQDTIDLYQAEMADLNMPLPDPAWDYAQIWVKVNQIQHQTIALTNQLQEQEVGSRAVDISIRARLKIIDDLKNQILGLLD